MGWTPGRRAAVFLLVVLVHVLLIAAVAGMRSGLRLRETAPPQGVGVVLFRWPGFGRPEAQRRRSPVAPRSKQTPPQPPAKAPALASPASAPAAGSSAVAPIPAAPPATGQLPAGLGRIIAEHARCYGFQLTDEERARCAGRDLGREDRELPLNIPAAKSRAWNADLERRHAPVGKAVTGCPKETGGSNFGTGCISPENAVRVPLP